MEINHDGVKVPHLMVQEREGGTQVRETLKMRRRIRRKEMADDHERECEDKVQHRSKHQIYQQYKKHH